MTIGANWFPLDDMRWLRLSAEATDDPETQADASAVVGAPDRVIGLVRGEDDGRVTVRLQAQIAF